MDTILKSFSLSFLLRSVFAGAFFVLSFCVAAKGGKNPLIIDSSNVFTVGLPFALIAGVVVYGIHRSVLYPLAEWILNADWAKRRRKKWQTLISKNSIEHLVTDWDLRAKAEKREQYRAQQIVIWADYVHFQYVSAWCIAFGGWTGMVIEGGRYQVQWPLFWLTGMFLVAATISNWRSHSVREHWSEIAAGDGATPKQERAKSDVA